MFKAKLLSFLLAACIGLGAYPAFAAGIDDVYVTLNTEAVQDESVYVEITAPVSGSTVYPGHTLAVEAIAESAGTGEIELVEFYLNEEATPFASDSIAPYTGVLQAGETAFSVTAKAYTTDGMYNEHKVDVTVSRQSSEGTTWLDADFDDGVLPDALLLDPKGEVAEIVETPAGDEARSGQSVLLKSEEGGAPLLDYVSEQPLSGEVVISISFLTDQAPWPGKKNSWLQVYDSSGAEVAQLLELNAAYINSFYDPSSTETNKRNELTDSLQANTWYDIEFVIDFDALTYSVSLNGENKGTDLALPQAAKADQWRDICRIRNRFGEAGYGFYIDSWRIASQPAGQDSMVYVDEDFDDSLDLPASFSVNASNATAGVAASPEDYEGSIRPGNSLYIEATESSQAPLVQYINQSNPITGTVVMEADILMTAASYPSAVELFYLISEKGNIARLGKVENSDINLWNCKSRGERIVQGFTPQRWYHFKYIVNTDTMTYDMELDGQSMASGVRIVPEANGVTDLEGLYACRFRMAGNGSSTSGLYVDNMKIYGVVSAQIEGAVFTSDSGVMSVDRTAVPAALRKIAVDFSAPMDAETFEGVTLTERDGGAAVGFSGEYSADMQQYIVTLEQSLQPGKSYTLAFPSSVLGEDGIGLTGSREIDFTTAVPVLMVNSIAVNGSDGAELDKSNTGGSVSAVVNLTANSDQAESVCVLMGVFSGETLQNMAILTDEMIDAGQTEDVILQIDNVDNDISDKTVRVFVWKNFSQLWPVCDVFER